MYMNTAADRACLHHRTSHRRTDFIDDILPGVLRALVSHALTSQRSPSCFKPEELSRNHS